jgi:hypothetical protein
MAMLLDAEGKRSALPKENFSEAFSPESVVRVKILSIEWSTAPFFRRFFCSSVFGA